MPPIVTLTTDFGLSDHYVGVMKGVILSICPQARIVDLSHQVTPFAIAEGAYLIAQAYRHFPKKTVHVVVVDPGVGTARRPILVEAAGQFFVSPDNGVLSMVYSREKHKVRVLTNERYFRKPVSQTFHGRDMFSPVGAHLAAGVAVARLGKRIEDYQKSGFGPPQPLGPGRWAGRILHIDRFGNIVTNFPAAEFSTLARKKFSLAVGTRQVGVLARNYAEGAPGELFVIAGSAGFWEVSVSQGSAAAIVGCQPGTPLELRVG
ncbi:MAG: SAM-dependent chlorinase/fluorinase [Acidobacteriia bacterium]|nr:SAM-dependent chlorinase/fluorinase [Terriglobia bacterium]